MDDFKIKCVYDETHLEFNAGRLVSFDGIYDMSSIEDVLPALPMQDGNGERIDVVFTVKHSGGDSTVRARLVTLPDSSDIMDCFVTVKLAIQDNATELERGLIIGYIGNVLARC